MYKNITKTKDFKWSTNLAYAVGLLATDGCLSSDGRHIIMRSSEIEQLKNFKLCLELKNIIGQTRNGNVISFRVQFGDVCFYKWLLKIGLHPRKSHTIKKINVPNKYFRDFLRGHLDGDGSITAYTDKYNIYKNPKYIYERLWVRFISASKDHIYWLQNKIKTLFEVSGRIHEAKSKRKNRVSIFVLKFGKKESIKLLSQIYYSDNIPFLRRKKSVAQPFLIV